MTKKHQDDKVIVFDRANCIFIFNFHGEKSFTDYGIGVRQSGLVLIFFSLHIPLFNFGGGLT